LFQQFEIPVVSLIPNAQLPTLPVNSIVCSDAFTALQALPDESVDCLVTSPPYYGQRDYRSQDQVGQEETPEHYIETLGVVFEEAKRVLKATGSLWLNLGDKYVDGELLGMPWRVAFTLKQRGWKLRSDIIWHKPNAMPSSVKNRPTPDHEYIFLFVKSDAYFYDTDAIREPHKTFTAESKMRGGRRHFGIAGGTPERGKNAGSHLHTGRWDQAFHPLGRSKRTVWSVPLSKFREAHFAVFPETLIQPCIQAGCPKSGIVLDPFFGSGTTGVVATKLARDFIGIELNEEYCQIAKRRIESL
jgi:site-specific DNA-methyltransferase (adenine-specific)